jgi:hypothetical protein
MHLHVDGIPMWTEDCPVACGHAHPVDDTPPTDINIDSTRPTDNTPMDGIDPSSIPTDVDDECIVHQLSRDQLPLIWHQRLGHIHSRRVAKMHEAADGIPKVPIATELDTCPVCAHAKLCKAACGQTSSHQATQCYQGISVNMGFMVQASLTEKAHIK